MASIFRPIKRAVFIIALSLSFSGIEVFAADTLGSKLRSSCISIMTAVVDVFRPTPIRFEYVQTSVDQGIKIIQKDTQLKVELPNGTFLEGEVVADKIKISILFLMQRGDHRVFSKLKLLTKHGEYFLFDIKKEDNESALPLADTNSWSELVLPIKRFIIDHPRLMAQYGFYADYNKMIVPGSQTLNSKLDELGSNSTYSVGARFSDLSFRETQRYTEKNFFKALLQGFILQAIKDYVFEHDRLGAHTISNLMISPRVFNIFRSHAILLTELIELRKISALKARELLENFSIIWDTTTDGMYTPIIELDHQNNEQSRLNLEKMIKQLVSSNAIFSSDQISPKVKKQILQFAVEKGIFIDEATADQIAKAEVEKISIKLQMKN
jgi:hypothetical protein